MSMEGYRPENMSPPATITANMPVRGGKSKREDDSEETLDKRKSHANKTIYSLNAIEKTSPTHRFAGTTIEKSLKND